MDGPSSAVAAGESFSLEKVAAAWQLLQPALWPVPLLRCPALDELCGYRVWLKAENLQRTGSYKIRGAYYKLHRLREEGRARKVVAASAGNHAQGVAYAARELSLDCVIVMPERASLPKRQATERYGAKVLLEGSCFDDSLAFALQYAAAEGREFISPFNDLDIITGQATIAWELLEEMRDHPPDAVLVPVGGGGLLAGVANVVKQRSPRTRLIALQSSRAPAFARSWNAYRAGAAETLPLDVPTEETIADGVRVRRPGELCWRLTRDLVAGAVQVDDPLVYSGIIFLLEHAKLVVEGAGALGVAALLDPAIRRQIAETGLAPGANVVVLVTGGNIDSLTLQHVIERNMAAKGRSRAVAVRIKDEPGQLGHILDFLRRKRATVLDLRRSWRSHPSLPDLADIEILIETEDERHAQEVLQELAQEAKTHHFELLLESGRHEGSTS
jgi:threonine dehydratase